MSEEVFLIFNFYHPTFFEYIWRLMKSLLRLVYDVLAFRTVVMGVNPVWDKF